MTYKVTDLVDDLRWIGDTDAETYEHVLEDVVHPTVKEAADELERLRGFVAELKRLTVHPFGYLTYNGICNLLKKHKLGGGGE